MNKEKFLTIRWNNILSLGLGLPTIIYGYIFLNNANSIGFSGFLGLVLIGVVYWIVVEQHSVMRFAWLRENSGKDKSIKSSLLNKLIMITYNVIWWLPIVLAFTKVIDYKTGFYYFFLITVFRALSNLFRNNILKGEKAEIFPFRAP